MKIKCIVLVLAFLLLAAITVGFFLRSSSSSVKRVVSHKKIAAPSFHPVLPSIEDIFGTHTLPATLPKDHVRVMIATGDVIPARVVNINATRFNNFLWSYEKTASVVKDADITFINLETPIIKDCPLINEGFKFCGNAKHIDGLLFAGVDVASVANNHAGNYGIDAIEETTKLLTDNNIAVTGRGAPAYKTIRGLTFAFLGFNAIGGREQGLMWADEEAITAGIKEARNHAGIVVVQYHWGTEYQSQPDENQIYLGHYTIDAGADLVIGNHPHWVQPVEIYKGKLITYAHGNYVFDQMWSEKTKQGVIGRYTFYDKQLVAVEYLPVQIEGYGQPYFLEGEKKQAILDDMHAQSILLSKTVQ